MIDGLLLALSPSLLIMTLAGVSLGIIWGALPGLSTTMAMGLPLSRDATATPWVTSYHSFGSARSARGKSSTARPSATSPVIIAAKHRPIAARSRQI